MIATYVTGGKLNIRGQHKPNNPRRWTVRVWARKGDEITKISLLPKTPCTMHDLHDYIMTELDAIEPEHVRWEACAR